MSRGVTALVTGASGFIGRALVDQLVQHGYRIVALTRDDARTFPTGVEPRIGDLATGAGVSSQLLNEVDQVFHCAGEVLQPGRMRDVHVGGTSRLLHAVRDSAGDRTAPIHWIQLSSVGAYGRPSKANIDRVVDEQTAENPAGEYEVTKTESDRLVTAAARDGLISCTMLRPSNVIGARMSNAALRRVIRMVRRGWFFYIGRPGAVANYVHVDDVASALVLAASDPRARGETFNLSCDCSWEELIGRVAVSCGVRTPRWRVPESVMRAISTAVGSRLGNPLTAARIDALVSRTRYPSTKIESVLQFRFARPMPAAIEDLMHAPNG